MCLFESNHRQVKELNHQTMCTRLKVGCVAVRNDRINDKSRSLFLDLLVVAPVGEEECVLALKSNEPDFEDGQVRAAAELNDVSIILTRDADAFRYSMIRTMTSAQYKELVQAEG